MKTGTFETKGGFVAKVVRVRSTQMGWNYFGYVKQGPVCIMMAWDNGGRCLNGNAQIDITHQLEEATA
jgi:hypothetical protein